MSSKSLSPSSNWSELPSDIQVLFMNKLFSIKDYIRFGAVCKSWNYVFTHYLDHKLPPELPLLMIPSIDTKYETQGKTRKFYCLTERRVLGDFDIKLPYKRCHGSKHGWLVISEEESGHFVRLYNPFLSVNKEIELPSLTCSKVLPRGEACFDDYVSLKKAFPSKNPTSNPNDYVVIGIVGAKGRVAFCKPGDKAWSIMPSKWKDFDDVTYYKGLFYAVGGQGEVIAIDLSVTNDHTRRHPVAPKVKIVAPPGPPSYLKGCIGMYIVESSGDLLQVQRFNDINRSYDIIVTNMFRVFKLLLDHEQDGENSKWIELKTLDGRMLFLGDNASISLPASDFSGCKPNCIYFTDDRMVNDDGLQDIGVFNLEDGSVEQLICPIDYGTCNSTPLIWIQPSLQIYNNYT